MSGYTIRFTAPDGQSVYAGEYKGTLGYAPTIETAAIWPEREIAERFLANGYGPVAREFGEVIEVGE